MTENIRDNPHYKRLLTFLDATRTETERGRALVSASLIEEMLDEILRSYFLEIAATRNLLEGSGAPLSSLSSKASACRAIGLITALEYRDINLVRKIRNLFAHSVIVDFENQKIRDWASSLQIGMHHLDDLDIGHESKVTDPKQRFDMVTTSLVTSLYNRAYYVKKTKVRDITWKA